MTMCLKQIKLFGLYGIPKENKKTKQKKKVQESSIYSIKSKASSKLVYNLKNRCDTNKQL